MAVAHCVQSPTALTFKSKLAGRAQSPSLPFWRAYQLTEFMILVEPSRPPSRPQALKRKAE